MPAGTVRARGLRQFQAAVAKAEKSTRRTVREGLKKAAEPVHSLWALRFSSIDRRSASKLRVVVRRRGVAVEQSLRRTTGLRPDYGRLQQRYGEAALRDRSEQVENALERAVDEIADTLEG